MAKNWEFSFNYAALSLLTSASISDLKDLLWARAPTFSIVVSATG